MKEGKNINFEIFITEVTKKQNHITLFYLKPEQIYSQSFKFNIINKTIKYTKKTEVNVIRMCICSCAKMVNKNGWKWLQKNIKLQYVKYIINKIRNKQQTGK